MNRRMPKLRRHASGHWFCRWAGRDHYFGRDRKRATQLYLASIAEFTAWRTQRDQFRLPPLSRSLTVQELHDRFVANREIEGGRDRADFYRKHLKRFVLAYSDAMAQHYKPNWLQILKDRLIISHLAPRTINHDIQAVRTMLQWAMDLELIAPVNLRGVKKLPLGEIPDKSWPVARVRQFVLGCPHPNLRSWLALCYLCALRPKECVRIMTGQGRWIQRGILVIPNKARRCRIARHVLFSAEAFRWWRAAKPQWSRLDSFSQACRLQLGSGPHALRHSAGTHLIAAGVAREDADSILGHYPRAISVTYMPLRWRHLRCLAARLTLEDPASCCILPPRGHV